ncbi:MAG: hypothetical protein QXD04_04585 [Candidatus Bathyarchaeia archaeon]|nr:hypothetical protein [Candidatus Bathyarchaeota archaeon]
MSCGRELSLFQVLGENSLWSEGLVSNPTILILNYGASKVTSKLYAELRSIGQVISEFDILIA